MLEIILPFCIFACLSMAFTIAFCLVKNKSVITLNKNMTEFDYFIGLGFFWKKLPKLPIIRMLISALSKYFKRLEDLVNGRPIVLLSIYPSELKT